MSRLSLQELKALKEQEQKINSEKNKKPKPRFEQEVFLSKDGKNYEWRAKKIKIRELIGNNENKIKNYSKVEQMKIYLDLIP